MNMFLHVCQEMFIDISKIYITALQWSLGDYQLHVMLPLPSKRYLETLLCLGCVGIITFQIPFFLVLYPQIQTTLRLVPGLSYLEIQSNNETIPLDCLNIDYLVTLPKCFDSSINSYGYCPGQVQAEFYKVYGRLYATGWEQGAKIPVSASKWLNRFDNGSNPSMLSAGNDWCNDKTKLYDPEGTLVPYVDDYYFNSRSDALDFVSWILTFILGGLLGLLIVSSIGLEMFAIYLVFYALSLLWDAARKSWETPTKSQEIIEDKFEMVKTL